MQATQEEAVTPRAGCWHTHSALRAAAINHPINHPFHPTVLGSEVHARWAKAKVSPGCSSKAQGGSCCPSGPEDGPRPRHANQGSGHVAPALTPKSPSSAFPLRDSCDDTVPTRALQDNPPPQDPLPCEAHPRVPGIRKWHRGAIILPLASAHLQCMESGRCAPLPVWGCSSMPSSQHGRSWAQPAFPPDCCGAPRPPGHAHRLLGSMPLPPTSCQRPTLEPTSCHLPQSLHRTRRSLL